jgi:septal ring factor EnvC (AmiA/AmiB activator)
LETPFAMYDALSALDVPPEKVRVVVQSMERDLALFATHSQFSALDQQSAGRFDLLRAEIAASRERLGHFDREFERIQQRFAEVDKRFEQVDKRFEQVDKRFEQVDKRFEQVDRRFEEMASYMNARFDVLDTRMATMQQQIEQRLTIRLGAFMAIATATLATLMTLLRG